MADLSPGSRTAVLKSPGGQPTQRLRPGKVESTPLSGADWFLASIEKMMLASGQGEHAGLSVLRLGRGFDVDALRSAAERLAEHSPIADGWLRTSWFGVPRWEWKPGTRAVFPIVVHAGPPGDLAHHRLNEPSYEPIRFDVLSGAEGDTVLILRWRHLLLDGKGAELLLGELARLAADPAAAPERADSWGPITPAPSGWRDLLGEAEKFKDHFYDLASTSIRSLGGAQPRAGIARFYIEEFSLEESARIMARAGEIFQIGWFLAVAMRVHQAVLLARGEEAESYQAGCAVQERKRGARHPIWQNHVSQLFFRLLSTQLGDLPAAARLLHEQFAAQTKSRLEKAFAVMSRFLRRMPRPLYLRMLRKNSHGHLTSFFFSHTGEFLPECQTFCGAPVENGWHVPSVCQPPGTGLFFSQRDGQLTATFSWREGSLREGELELMCKKLREDLLGESSTENAQVK